MGKYLEIKVTKATLYLTEQELMTGLPRETLKTALKRGKAFKRSRDHKARGEKKEAGNVRR